MQRKLISRIVSKFAKEVFLKYFYFCLWIIYYLLLMGSKRIEKWKRENFDFIILIHLFIFTGWPVSLFIGAIISFNFNNIYSNFFKTFLWVALLPLQCLSSSVSSLMNTSWNACRPTSILMYSCIVLLLIPSSTALFLVDLQSKHITNALTSALVSLRVYRRLQRSASRTHPRYKAFFTLMIKVERLDGSLPNRLRNL